MLIRAGGLVFRYSCLKGVFPDGAVPSIDLVATGIRITQLRQQAGLTVRDLQDIFGFSTPQAIYKWQRGEAMPTVDNLVILAAVFGTTIDTIIVRTGTVGQARIA